MRRLIALGVVLSLTGWSRPARACVPTVSLAGDARLIAGITPLLADRGIATAAGACPAVPVELARRGNSTIVSTPTPTPTPSWGYHPTQSVVSDLRTAATVIESWVRTDVEAPLLAPRPRQDPESPADSPAEPAADLPALATSPSAPPRRGFHVFSAGERSLASDGTGWFGLQLGACVTLGAVCASTLVRLGAVTDGPPGWQTLDRHAVELLLGVDVPVRLGRVTLSPGLAGGVGWMHTHDESSRPGDETGGLRAESHLTLAYPLGPRLAATLALSFELTQATHMESSSATPLPSEPRYLSRLGLGVRFEGL